MTFTAAQMRIAFPRAPEAWAPALDAAWSEFGLSAISQQAGHLGVIGNESAGLTGSMKENMNYTAEQAFQFWPAKCRANPEKTRALCSRGDGGRGLANWVYADLYGNGPEESGDGWNRRGHGPLQITFTHTLGECGKALGIDLLANPDLICEPVNGARSAAWFVAVYKPQIAAAWLDPSVEAFLAGAKHVGWTDPAHTAVRIEYRRKALIALGANAIDAGDSWLRRGMSGPDVEALQKALNFAYGRRLDVDGQFGPKTHDLVIEFQKANGLDPDGVVGPKTRAALRM